MGKVKLTVTFAKCRCGYHHTGDEYLVGDLCPPLCHELWHGIYPAVYTLLNGGLLDCGDVGCRALTPGARTEAVCRCMAKQWPSRIYPVRTLPRHRCASRSDTRIPPDGGTPA